VFDLLEKEVISDPSSPYDTDAAPNRVVEERRARLRQALKAAGGNKVVAAKSGVSLSSLNEYVAGAQPRLMAGAAIAKACDVSLEWLATGEGPMARLDLPANVGQGTLLGTVNTDRLAIALAVIGRRMGLTAPTRDHAVAIIALYDIMAGMSEQEQAAFVEQQAR
jgi:hypothetical protein